MNTKITINSIAIFAALIAMNIAVKSDIWWLAVIIGALIIVCGVRSIILSRKADKEAWDKHRFISRILNDIEKDLFEELHKELAGIKGIQPVNNVHPGSRVSEKYLAMVEEREGSDNNAC